MVELMTRPRLFMCITSRSSRICSLRPPTLEKLTLPGSSEIIEYTVGSTSRGSFCMMVSVVMSRDTRVPSFSSFLSNWEGGRGVVCV